VTEFLRLLSKRLAQTIIVVMLVTTVVFFLLHLAPGDPFTRLMENPNVTEAIRQQWIESFGLDKPLLEQYWRYLINVARGDFGWSFSMRRPVLDVWLDALPYTLTLSLVALVFGFAIGIAVAVFQARRSGSRADRIGSAIAMVLHSVPDFWLALILMLALGYWFPIFPVAGASDPVMYEYLSPWGKFFNRLHHLALPAFALTLLTAASVSRYQRDELLRVLPDDYIQTARAKGVSERRIIWHHALRNALLPTISEFGLLFPFLFTGAVFVEKVFAWPGMGWTIVNAVATRDYPLVTAGVIISSATIAIGSLIADLLYPLADPRVLRSTKG
jgi:peptide/nickel transport system permease protein